MDLRDQRTILALGGGVAALAGVVIAFGLIVGHRGERTPPPPASHAGLVIDSSARGLGKIDPARSLRCFVDGKLVGEMSLADCARRNGVASDALDVGVDASGALAASSHAGTTVTPLPPPAAAPAGQGAGAAAPVQAASAPAGACWRYADGQWRRLPSDLTLNACVQALYAGHCERQGEATYGRWIGETLRLVPGKVEVSSDNHSFRTLVEQGAGCSLPAVG